MRNLDMIFEELSHIEYMVKESNSTVDSNLVYEGFWDTVRQGASKLGQLGAGARNLAVKGVNAVKSGINYVKELGQKAWDKIVALGEEFVAWVKMVKEKALSLLAAIKATPAKIWESMKEFYQWLAQGIGNKVQELKTGWDMFVMLINTFVFQPIVNFFKQQLVNAEMTLAYIKYASIEELNSLKAIASETKNKGLEKWNALMTKIYGVLAAIPGKAEELGNYLANLGKKGLLILAGLIVAPFYLTFKGLEFVYKLGEQFVNTIAKAVGNAWDELQTLPGAVKAGYESIPKVQPLKNESKRNIMSFDDFLKRS
jgi:hypothetical protein